MTPNRAISRGITRLHGPRFAVRLKRRRRFWCLVLPPKRTHSVAVVGHGQPESRGQRVAGHVAGAVWRRQRQRSRRRNTSLVPVGAVKHKAPINELGGGIHSNPLHNHARRKGAHAGPHHRAAAGKLHRLVCLVKINLVGPKVPGGHRVARDWTSEIGHGGVDVCLNWHTDLMPAINAMTLLRCRRLPGVSKKSPPA